MHFVLRAVQGSNGRRLGHRASARRNLRLHLGHRFNQRLRPCPIANAPPCHGIGFRYAIHGQHAVFQLWADLNEGIELLPIKQNVLINLI